MQRQLSLDNPYQQNEYQNQLNYHQDQRRHHSHDRVDRSSRNNYQQDQQQNYGRFLFGNLPFFLIPMYLTFLKYFFDY